MLIILLLFLFLRGTDAVRYHLTESEYAGMPPLNHLDSYEACQQDEDAMYCMSEYLLVSDKPSELLDMIQEYSDHQLTHYNHTKIRYGICVKQTCQKFYDKHDGDLRLTLEACLNESFTEKYDLKVKLLDVNHCREPGKHPKDIDRLDVIVGVICVLLLLTNAVGTFCDYYFEKNVTDNTALRFLLCFSMLRNWKKLMAPAGSGQDPRLERLRGINGIRVITICLMIFHHSLFPPILLLENTEYLEKSYSVKVMQIFINGQLIMQTFLFISAFLLIYNNLIYSEKHPISWSLLPKYIIIRWLRLTSAYSLVLALTTTWFAHMSSGPLWNKIVMRELKECRQYWWHNILYINNYTERAECMRQCWYLAADTQLYCLAVLVFLSCRTAGSRKIALSLMFAAGVILPALHVFFQDLDGGQLASPETLLDLFINDPHFNLVYIRAHTNIIGYAVGMTTAYLVYHWQKLQVDFIKYQTFFYRVLYWSLFPLATWCCYIGGMFYEDGPRHSVYVRTLFAAFLPLVFILAVSGIIIGFIFKFEGLYRSVVEWSGWIPASRLSYCAYLLHCVLVRYRAASLTTTVHLDDLTAMKTAVTVLTETFIAAVFLWLMVEAPCNNLIKECFSKQKTEEKQYKEEKETKKKI